MTDQEWEVVAEFSGTSMEALADIAVGHLKSEGIEAVRLPIQNMLTLLGGAVSEPIKILVPPDRAEEARGILAGIEDAAPE